MKLYDTSQYPSKIFRKIFGQRKMGEIKKKMKEEDERNKKENKRERE